MNKENYYKSIEDHYDREARTYEQRQLSNTTLQKIRKDFRKKAGIYMTGKRVLDFGCGVGDDLCYFAKKYPDKKFFGLDISQKMIDEAGKKVVSAGLKNIRLIRGSIENLENSSFDFIYVFFGSLNTVHDLNGIAEKLFELLAEDGKIFVTFVNRWYPMGILSFLKGFRIRMALDRVRNKWGGYSDKHQIKSYVHFPGEIKKAFNNFHIIYKRGYSIIYPAWYQDRITTKLGKFADKLWKIDTFLSKTFLWSWGEYTLFVFKKK